MFMAQGGLSVGYQFFHFGTMAPVDYWQRGVGAFVGGHVGVAYSTIAGAVSSSIANAQYEPEVQLSFPGSNFGNTKRAAFYISAYVLPTGDFLFASAQFGGGSCRCEVSGGAARARARGFRSSTAGGSRSCRAPPSSSPPRGR